MNVLDSILRFHILFPTLSSFEIVVGQTKIENINVEIVYNELFFNYKNRDLIWDSGNTAHYNFNTTWTEFNIRLNKVLESDFSNVDIVKSDGGITEYEEVGYSTPEIVDGINTAFPAGRLTQKTSEAKDIDNETILTKAGKQELIKRSINNIWGQFFCSINISDLCKTQNGGDCYE